MAEKSSFTDREFKAMSDCFEKNNPDLANNGEKIKGEISEFDTDIKDYQQRLLIEEDGEKVLTLQCAIKLLLQGRNFLARFIGLAELPMPEFEWKPPELMGGQIRKKWVAVVMADKSEVTEKAMAQVLKMAFPDVRYKFYRDYVGLIKDLPSLAGIVSASLEPTSFSIESGIRHDLKNQPGWDVDRANEVILPPCYNGSYAEIIVLMDVMKQMQAGDWRVNKEKFVLSDSLSSLLVHAKVPSKLTEVYIIDDEQEMIAGIKLILNSWPKLACYCFQDELLDVGKKASGIFLIDEDLGNKRTGTDLVAQLKKADIPRVFASISGGAKPAFTEHHFQLKSMVKNNYSAARQFVSFMNKLIE